MAGGKARGIPTPLEKTRQRLERWRQTHPAKSRIPERLWDAAARMAERYGVACTASVLRLDYYRLKRRTEQNAFHRSETPSAATRTTFLELPVPVQTAAAVPTAAECVVELEDGAGAKMRIHLKGVEAADPAAWIRSFVGR